MAGSSSSSPAPAAAIPLSNVEAQWEKLSGEEQLAVHQQLEQIQKKDWKELSIDEKKAAYYVAFGPHGPRAPVNPPGSGVKILFATLGLIGTTGLLYYALRQVSVKPPNTMTREWQEASNERAKEQKMNPISGISSEGYSGKGFVTVK
ncbi:cytochrome c oxidase subunit IV [Gloeophyllum trabeum ATCC 11539]|uniref:Cytochrome c oxidase subunit IV n=1 Tax=Gloeophyllum trabeum (strain ATCC 11539 / FP-39264 / Madison 617) TaxID=670483 RepID=S7QD97_GLOTA|nr:cytochrome c oxidase subunit IV [Gloeophyllum trabeum ATCC 11539]EPQ57821.1 cytochrome c oxidase subunit IV [Gloeophyllum trabeum ATCC 11539]